MTNSPAPSPTDQGQTRQLGLFDSTMVVMGIVLGSGIFTTTGIIAQYLPSPGLILLAWLGGGLLTLAGALTYAELGAAMPQAGGHYVYLREAYGPMWGFLSGWIYFLVYMTGGIAALAAAFAEYLGFFWPWCAGGHVLAAGHVGGLTLSLTGAKLTAVVVIVLLSGLNYLGLVLGKLVQNILTVVKIGSLLALVGLGLTYQGPHPDFTFGLALGTQSLGQLLMGFGLAMVAVSWAYDGWNCVNLVAGEIKQPGRTLPRALLLGTAGVTVLYLLVNIAYLRALPLSEMMGVVRVAEKSVMAISGSTGAALVTVAVLLSTFGSLNGSILTGPRLYFAMARDGLFFRKAGNLHPRFRTPGRAILLQAFWSCLLALSGTFEQLFTFVMFVAIMFWIGAASSVITLRRKHPDLRRPYRAWGFPWVAYVFILASSGILVNALVEKPLESLAGLLLTVAGIPVYFFWRRQGPPDPQKDP